MSEDYEKYTVGEKAVIQGELKKLTQLELKRSYWLGHDNFMSPHEGYAVLLEEIEELQEDVGEIGVNMAGLWRYIRSDVPETADTAGQIYDTALKAAYEAIQVAAMAKKYQDSLGTSLGQGD